MIPMLNMDSSKKSYASIAAFDLNEPTSLPHSPHLHHLFLNELGITDIQACKAALSDSDTLTYDQDLWNKSAALKNGRKVPRRKSHSWKAKIHGMKFQLQKPLPRFFQAHGYSVTRELRQESQPSSRQDIVFEVTYKKTHQKLMHQLSHGAPSGLSLSSPLPKTGSQLCGLQQCLCHLKDPVWIHLPRGYKSKSTTPTCL